MAERRLFDADPDTGETVWFEPTEDGGFTLQHEQDCEPILDHNQALRSTGDDAWKAGGDYRLEASIPNTVLMKWLVEDGIKFWTPEGMQRIVKRVNDSDWRHLKTFNGRI